jgi:apolipoprotein D and lipocalin family protein
MTRILSLLSALLLAACQTITKPPLQVMPQVDLPRFMGDWYVIANIPTFVEKGAHNAVESYRLNTDGSIAVNFTFRKDSFDGKQKHHQPRGFVVEGTGNAIWGMRFLWPFKSDYRITHVNSDYSQTIISREKRDYVWIMARTPTIPDADYQQLVGLVAAQGYDVNKLQKVPQRQ